MGSVLGFGKSLHRRSNARGSKKTEIRAIENMDNRPPPASADQIFPNFSLVGMSNINGLLDKTVTGAKARAM